MLVLFHILSSWLPLFSDRMPPDLFPAPLCPGSMRGQNDSQSPASISLRSSGPSPDHGAGSGETRNITVGLGINLNPCAAFGSHDPKVHNELLLCLPNTKTNTNNFLLTFAMWGVWDRPTVKRKILYFFLYAVKLSQYDSGSQWLMGQIDPKIIQGF